MTRSHPETNYPCDCHVLDRMADEPHVPIVFDAETNEYQLRYDEENKSHAILYYCHFCGGRLPDTRRHQLFARITWAETLRLRKLTRDIQTIDDAIRILGTPDSDDPAGIIAQTPDIETECTQIKSYRQISYNGLSETAVVRIREWEKDKIHIEFAGRLLKGEPSAPAAEKPVRTPDSPALKDQEKGRSTIYCSFCGHSEHAAERMLWCRSAAICNGCAEEFLQSSGR